MYAIVTRRKMNAARMQETRERASREFWPTLQQMPGFVSFTLVQGEDGVNTTLTLWESKAQADAFRAQAKTWGEALDAYGHQVETQGGGEVIEHLSARA